MSRFIGLGSFLLAAMLGTPAFAQDGEFSPSNDDLNQDLDQSLHKEFSEDHPPPPGADAPAGTKKEKRDRFKITLGLMGAYYHTQLFDIDLSYREGLSGGNVVRFADRDDHDGANAFEFEQGSGTYRAWIDFGKHIAITGGFRTVRYDDTQTLVSNQAQTQGQGTGPFTFGDTSFQAGDTLSAEFELLVADSDFVFRPLNNQWLTIDMSVGARYIFWKTTFNRENGAQSEVSSTIEGAMPMVGLGIAFRPVSILEIFGRVRVGGLDYEVDTSDYDSDEIDEYDLEDKEREMRSYEVDLGIKLIFGETVGLIVGYRLDYIELQRRVASREETVKAKAHGLYGGLILQF